MVITKNDLPFALPLSILLTLGTVTPSVETNAEGEGVDDSTMIDPDEFAKTFEFEPTLPPIPSGRPWAMLSAHGHVLVLIARDRAATDARIAAELCASVAVVRRIIADLIDAGMIARAQLEDESGYVITSDDPVVAKLTAPRSVAALSRLYGSTA